ncbi:MAG: hypothetical protein K9I85_03835 [Saprospiraceae bacterium]|nr:hypothetical protein [Saprospiraceae bacterium]
MKRILTIIGIIGLCYSTSYTQITGTAFRDYNGNGIKEGGEPGVADIIVNFYSNAALPAKDQLVGTVTTNTSGAYSYTPPSYPIRVEFTIPSSGACDLMAGQDYPAANGDTYGTSVQLLTGDGTANFIVSYPVDFALDENPPVYVPCYTNGDPLAGGNAGEADALVSFHYMDSGYGSNSGRGPTNPVGPAHGVLAITKQIGSAYGVAYSRQSDLIFTSAFMKRHSGFGPLGGGGIYVVDPNNIDLVGSLAFMDFDALGIPTSDEIGAYTFPTSNSQEFVSNVIGTNALRGLPATKSTPNNDPAAYTQAGKLSFGDMDISEDGRYLYIVNLYDRKLYSIDLVDPFNPTAPTLLDVGTRVKAFPIPNPCTTTENGEYRPFALKIRRGKVFVGVTCSGEDAAGATVGTLADVLGTVYEFDIATETFDPSPKLQFDFNYTRTKNFAPWRSSWLSGNFNEIGAPMISDIEFDAQGNMLLGVRDRRGDQFGYQNYPPVGTTLYNDATVGELLRAVRDPNGASCNDYTIQFNPEYYNDNGVHQEETQGGLVVHYTAAFDGVLTTVLDPIGIWSGGTWLYNNATGQRANVGYEIFYSAASGQGASTFGKANGLGDLEAQGIVPPIEIGNLVWEDTDRDGIQDGDEPGIAGVMVELLDSLGNLIAMDVTDNDGGYYFNFDNVNAPSGPDPYTTYMLRIKPAQFVNGEGQGVLAGYLLTLTNEVGNGALDQSDNDAALVGGVPKLTFTTGANGQNNHSYDFGFTPCEVTTAGLDPISILCNDGGTPNGLTTDDFISFTLTPEGIQTHNPYTVSVIGGGTTITPTSANFGVPTNFQLGAGSADGATTWTIRVTDGDDPNCFIEVQIGPIDNCSENCDLVLNPEAICQLGGDLYDLVVSYTYVNDLDDDLTIMLGSGEMQTVAAPGPNGAGMVTFTGLSNLGISDIPVTGAFANNVFCSADTSYDSPDYCCFMAIDTIVVSDCFLGTYSVDLTLTFAGVPNQLVVDINNQLFNITPSSPFGTETFTISGLDCKLSTGYTVDVLVYNIDLPVCNDSRTNYYEIPKLIVDLGDLPINYPVTFNNNGAYHTMTPLLYLGNCVDNEIEGQPNQQAGTIINGDDHSPGESTTYGNCTVPDDDEDGLLYTPMIAPGAPLSLCINLLQDFDEDAYLTAWIDWNANGFLEAGEQVINQTVTANTGSYSNCFTVNVPTDAVLDTELAVRVRLNLNGPALPTGLAIGGEVEDYMLVLSCNPAICLPASVTRKNQF